MDLTRTVYQAVPDGLKPLAKHGYMLFRPGLSWRKWAHTPDGFVEEFFDDRSTFDAYVAEFWNSRITDVVDGAHHRTPDDVQVYDAHRFFSERLYALLRKRQPRTVVETGVYHGVSTAVILLALEKNGRGWLYSIDDAPSADPDGGDRDEPDAPTTGANAAMARGHPSCAERDSHVLPPGKEPGWIIPEEMRTRWHLRTGDQARELPVLLAELDGVDVFLHDSAHSRHWMLREFDLAWDALRPGGVLLSHHIGWNDAFETFVEERSADHGLVSYTYFGKYDRPGRSGYARKR